MEENHQMYSTSQPPTNPLVGVAESRTVQLFIFRSFRFKNEPATLSWSTSTGMLQLKRQASDISPAADIFNVPFEQVEKADFSFGGLYLIVAGQKYGLVMHERNKLFAPQTAILARVASDIAVADRAGLDELRQILLAKGVLAKRVQIARSVLIGLVIGVAVFIILIAAAYALIPQNP